MPAGLQQSPSAIAASTATSASAGTMPDAHTLLREVQEAPVPERPALSIFKSIFSSESDSSSSEEESKQEQAEEIPIASPQTTALSQLGIRLQQPSLAHITPSTGFLEPTAWTPVPRLTLVNTSSINLVAKAQQAASVLQASQREQPPSMIKPRPVFQSTKPIGQVVVSSSSDDSSTSESEEEVYYHSGGSASQPVCLNVSLSSNVGAETVVFFCVLSIELSLFSCKLNFSYVAF